jgi:hypothetical protein
MSGERCPRCGKLQDDHLCVTDPNLAILADRLKEDHEKVEKLARSNESLKAEVEHIRRHEKHRVFEIEPISIRCRCGREFHDWRAFHDHAEEPDT